MIDKATRSSIRVTPRCKDKLARILASVSQQRSWQSSLSVQMLLSVFKKPWRASDSYDFLDTRSTVEWIDPSFSFVSMMSPTWRSSALLMASPLLSNVTL